MRKNRPAVFTGVCFLRRHGRRWRREAAAGFSLASDVVAIRIVDHPELEHDHARRAGRHDQLSVCGPHQGRGTDRRRSRARRSAPLRSLRPPASSATKAASRAGKVDYFGASGAIMWSPFIICFFMWVFLFIGAIWSPDMWSAVVASGSWGRLRPARHWRRRRRRGRRMRPRELCRNFSLRRHGARFPGIEDAGPGLGASSNICGVIAANDMSLG